MSIQLELYRKHAGLVTEKTEFISEKAVGSVDKDTGWTTVSVHRSKSGKHFGTVSKTTGLDKQKAYHADLHPGGKPDSHTLSGTFHRTHDDAVKALHQSHAEYKDQAKKHHDETKKEYDQAKSRLADFD